MGDIKEEIILQKKIRRRLIKVILIIIVLTGCNDSKPKEYSSTCILS